MLSKILDKKHPAFSVIQEPGSFIISRREEKGKKVLKIVAFLYLLAAVSISVAVLAVYLKGAKIYDGKEMPLWFVAVILICEWLPAYFLFWFAFSASTYVFDHNSLIIRAGIPGSIRKKISIPKNRFRKVMIISQSEDSSVCALKIQAEDREYKILWLQPYDQCLWFGSVIAEWTGVPIDKGSHPNE
jgi:hypothetical protein